MHSAVGQSLAVLAVLALPLAGCSTRPPVLPPPAPTAGPAVEPPTPPTSSVDAARRAEESIERVDVSAWQSARQPAPSREAIPVVPAARLRARVVDPLGNPVSGALVILHSLTDGEEQRAHTDSAGDVVFNGLAPGDYLLGGDPADGPELTAIPLRLAAGDAPETIEIRLLGSGVHQGESLSAPSLGLVSA